MELVARDYRQSDWAGIDMPSRIDPAADGVGLVGLHAGLDPLYWGVRVLQWQPISMGDIFFPSIRVGRGLKLHVAGYGMGAGVRFHRYRDLIGQRYAGSWLGFRFRVRRRCRDFSNLLDFLETLNPE